MPRFPLDGAFAELRREVEAVQAALAGFRRDLSGAGGGKTPGTTGAEGAADRQANRESFARQAREAVRTISELQRSVKAGGGIARSLGLSDLGQQLDRAANKIETVKVGVEGFTAALKLLRGAFVPVLVGTAAIVGPLLVVQKVFEELSGKALSLTQTIQVMGLSLLEFAGKNLKTLAGPIGGTLMEKLGLDPAQSEDARIALEALHAQIQEIISQGGAPGSTTTGGLLSGLLGDVVAQVEKLVKLVPESDSVLGKLVTPEAFSKNRADIASLRLEMAKLAKDPELIHERMRGSLEAELQPLILEAAQLHAALNGGGEAARGSRERLALINEEIGLRRTLLEKQIENASAFGQFAEHFSDISDTAEATFGFITSGVEQIGATISQALLDAFLRPQADIRDSFANLFAALGQQILQMITQLLIAKAITATIGAFGGGGAEAGAGAISGIAKGLAGGIVGKAEGGPVSGPRLPPLPGLPSSDTIAARLTPGEYVQTADAVNTYGLQVMEAIRQKAIPVGALRALAAGISLPGIARTPRVAFAGGGQVPMGGGPTGAAPIQAFVVPNEAAAARLNSGGHGANIRYFRENAAALKSALGVK